MRKKILSVCIIALCVGLFGCSESESSDRQPSQDSCDFAGARCNGNVVETCVLGKISKSPCQNETACKGGACVPVSVNECQDGEPATCESGMRFYCVGNKLQYEVCQSGACKDGHCLECEGSAKDCKDNSTRRICTDGFYQVEKCNTGLCLDGTCVECIDEVQECIDSKTRRYCDDHMYRTETCPGVCKGGRCETIDLPKDPECGNGIIEAGEACDDGSSNGQYGKCRKDCQSKSICGDGIVDSPNEECEPSGDGKWLRKCNDLCKTINEKEVFASYPSADEGKLYLDNKLPKCSEDDLFLKYMHYRRRFLGDESMKIPGFVSFGMLAGESLPAESREPLASCKGNWRFEDCGFEDYPDAQGAYYYGDTSLWLGVMVHWLATEWRVFHELGRSTEETERNIYYALKAFDRLDLHAEEIAGIEGRLDGFFVRDDFPLNYAKKGTKYRFVRTDAPNAGYECASSSNTCDIHTKDIKDLVRGGTFVSQDQITGIFEGYGMLIALLPEGIVVDGVDLKIHAMETIHRIMTFVKDHEWLLGLDINGRWIQVPETWGGFLTMMSGMMASAANKMLGDKFGVSDYHDKASALSLAGTKLLLDGFWPSWENENNYNRNLVLRFMAWTDLWDATTYNQKALTSGRDIYALMRSFAWNENIEDSYPLWEMHQILSTAPCDGPCNGSICKEEVPGWMGESYFTSPRERFGYGYHSDVEYNGLDYLIGHNLYLLAYMKRFGHGYSQKLPSASMGKPNGMLYNYIYKSGSFTTYDASAAGNVSDLKMAFCGKLFGDWIRDASEGLVDIYTGDKLWKCDSTLKCTIAADESAYQHKNSLIIGSNKKDTFDIKTSNHHCVVSFNGGDDIKLSGGSAVIEAGDGNNTIQVSNTTSVIYTGKGNDTIKATGGMQMVMSGGGDDNITTDSYSDLIDGGSGDDIIQAGNGCNGILGGSGNDTIYSGNQNGYIRGNDGNDRIKVGSGNNMLYGDNGDNLIVTGNGDNSITASYPLPGLLYLCLGKGKNSVWGGWSNDCRASDAPKTDFHNNTCPGKKLSSSECSDSAFDAWGK